MDSIVDTKTIGAHTVNVLFDYSMRDISPRENDNLGTFFIASRSHASPDTPPHSDPMEAKRIATNGDNICLPVWAYSHGATVYQAAKENPYSCPWDSGLAGFIYVTRADVRKAYGFKRISAANLETVINALKSEVAEYSAWANGEVYGFEVLDKDGAQVDSCFGYIGAPSAALEDGIASAEWLESRS